jgi:hypothetical protein
MTQRIAVFVPVSAAALLALAACSQSPSSGGQTGGPPASPPSADASASNATSATADANSAASKAATPQAPMLAMAYKLGLVIPAALVRHLMESHQEACERAGSDQCQVLSANASAEGDDRASADLTLRATPAWMRVFRTRAEADATDLGGKIDEASTDGEDLSTQVVDHEAAQRSRAAERDRLTQLMQRRTKDVGQTLQVDQQITQVQGEMDQAASELAAMKGRIAMQTATISYRSPAVVGPRGVTAPLAEAGRSFLSVFFTVLGGILMVAAVVAPFALVGAPVAWWLMRRKKKAAAPPVAGEVA